MINKQLLASLFEDYVPELGDDLVDVVLNRLSNEYDKHHIAMITLKRHKLYYDIFSTPSDILSRHRRNLFYIVYPPSYSEKEVQAYIFNIVMPIIISNFIAHIKHSPLNKTQVISMNAWINQLHGLGLSDTANLLDRVYVHHSLSL